MSVDAVAAAEAVFRRLTMLPAYRLMVLRQAARYLGRALTRRDLVTCWAFTFDHPAWSARDD